jgi:hypothetical protein
LKEKRRTKRIKEADKATIVLNSEIGNQQIKKVYHVLTKDLSTRGIKIPINTFIPVDTSVKIQISLENPTKLIYTNGKIRWVKRLYNQQLYEAGIELVDMTPYQSEILEKHIRKTE